MAPALPERSTLSAQCLVSNYRSQGWVTTTWVSSLMASITRARARAPQVSVAGVAVNLFQVKHPVLVPSPTDRWEIRDDIHQAFLALGCALICW